MLGSRGERTLIHSKSKFGEDVGKDVYFCNVAERKRVCSIHRGHTHSHSHSHTIVTVIVSITYLSHASLPLSLSPPTQAVVGQVRARLVEMGLHSSTTPGGGPAVVKVAC